MNPVEQHDGRVLIVDDDESVLALLRATLCREGYNVTAVSEPRRAVALLKEQEFGLLLSDQQMPEMTGLELLAQARRIRPDTTRVLITGVPSLEVVVQSINKGEIYRFIVKPWLREELLATVQNGLQRYQMQCQGRQLQEATEAVNRALAQEVERSQRQNQELESLNSTLRGNTDRSVQLCVRTLEAFYPVLGNQANRVRELCRAMADVLQMPPALRQSLEAAALLHDLGLIELPRRLIRRWWKDPNSLAEPEMERIRRHPILGQELIGFVESFEDVGRIVRSHHERFDGTGYPDRLIGDQIHWLARVLSPAVAYVSVPDPVAALAMVQAGSGHSFDPEVVRVFRQALPKAVLPRRRHEVLLADLKPGMVVARRVSQENGSPLLSDGDVLSETYISRLRGDGAWMSTSDSLVIYG